VRITEVKEAVENAKREIRIADNHVAEMASLIAGRLRLSKIPQRVLEQLKHELRDYDMRTGVWKDK
jgi:hypothetical protein